MTTFSPEAPSSLHPAPVFAHVIPPFICVHLPLPINSRFPHHNRSFSFRIWTWRRGALLCRCRFILFRIFPHHLHAPRSPLWSFSASCCFTSCFSTSAFLSSVLAGAVALPPRYLRPPTHTSATEPPIPVAFSIT